MAEPRVEIFVFSGTLQKLKIPFTKWGNSSVVARIVSVLWSNGQKPLLSTLLMCLGALRDWFYLSCWISSQVAGLYLLTTGGDITALYSATQWVTGVRSPIQCRIKVIPKMWTHHWIQTFSNDLFMFATTECSTNLSWASGGDCTTVPRIREHALLILKPKLRAINILQK